MKRFFCVNKHKIVVEKGLIESPPECPICGRIMQILHNKCPECGEKINTPRDKRVWIDDAQMHGYPWCEKCGLIIDK